MWPKSWPRCGILQLRLQNKSMMNEDILTWLVIIKGIIKLSLFKEELQTSDGP